MSHSGRNRIVLLRRVVTAVVGVASLWSPQAAWALNNIKFTSTALPVSAGSTPGPQTIALADVGGPGGVEDSRDDILVLDTD